MGDFGTEELTLGSGSSIPDWEVYYPINVLEAVQQLPDNYMSKESAENLLHQVGDLQGFDFNGISKDSETGNWQIDGLVDTKETIFTLYTLFGYTNTLDSRDIGAFNKITFNNRIKVKIGLMGGSSYGWGIARLISKGYDNEATIIYNDKPSGNLIRIVTLFSGSYVIKTIR